MESTKRIRTAEHNKKIGISNRRENLSAEALINKSLGCSKRSKNPEYLKKLSVANRGEKALNHKIKESDVREIKRLWETGIHTTATISDLYPISRQSVRDIIAGRTWKHVN